MTDDALIGPGEAERVAHMLGIVRSRVDPAGLRILDLACRTGAFATALAEAGADVLGIEGRQDNLEHTPSSTVRYELGDVRDLSLKAHGSFDVTLCLGILYHLTARDALRLLARMREVTKLFAVVDTHIGIDAGVATVDGREYRGWPYGEVGNHPWSSLDDQVSWWFTVTSLAAAFQATGWTEATTVPGQGWSGETADRRWIVIS